MKGLSPTTKCERFVLYVEDEQSDVFFMELAFGEENRVHLQTVNTGQQAMDYLAGTGPYCDREHYPLPSLILLDLKLPVVSGFDVLRWLRDQRHLKSIPVVVFSSSPNTEDRARALEMGANDFLTKPSSGLQFGAIVHGLVARWIGPAPTGLSR